MPRQQRITPEKLALAAQEAGTDLQIGQNPYAVPVKPEGLTTVRHLLEDQSVTGSGERARRMSSGTVVRRTFVAAYG